MQVVELEVTLADLPYPVQRRLRVPVSIGPADLHRVLQAAMPWQGGHLHEFRLGAGDGRVGQSLRRAALAEILAGTGVGPRRMRAFVYIYDLGDGWEHRIVPGAPFDLPVGAAPVALLDAVGRCPPEDSGGAPGFAHLLSVAADPDDDEHADVLDWLGDDHPWTFEADAAALAAAVGKAGARLARKPGGGG